MARDEDKAIGGSVTVPATALFVVALAPVLYVLSVGPALMFYEGDLPDAWLAFYAPLVWLDENVPACRAFFSWYESVWVS